MPHTRPVSADTKELVDHVESMLDDAAALGSLVDLGDLLRVLTSLRYAALTRRAGAMFRMEGNINLASGEEDLSELHVRNARS